MVDGFSKICSSKDKRKSTIQDPFRAINPQEESLIFSVTAYKVANEKSSFGYATMIKGYAMDVGAWIGTKVISSYKEVETRAFLTAIKKAKENGYARIVVLTDAKEVLKAIHD